MSKVIRLGVVGLGRMGRSHMGVLKRMEREGLPLKITAVCDIQEEVLTGKLSFEGNLSGMGKDAPDYSSYSRYTDFREMFSKEELDAVDIVAPTYMHDVIAIAAMKAGIDVFCEKPMAVSVERCQAMIDTSVKTGRKLMIGHCLRFWQEYVYLKETVQSGIYGKVQGAYFYRGGAADHVLSPSYQHWIITREKGGGGLFDQHIHDIDAINWVFGVPEYVSASGKTVHPDSAYDIVATNYFYDDDSVITAIDDTAYKGVPFAYGYKVDLEKACLVFDKGFLTVYPDKAEPFTPDMPGDKNAYFNELSYFIDCILNDRPIERCRPQDSLMAVKVAVAEMKSADVKGTKVQL